MTSTKQCLLAALVGLDLALIGVNGRVLWIERIALVACGGYLVVAATTAMFLHWVNRRNR